MKQNIYDDPHFFERYMAYRNDPHCLNDTIEQPAIWDCLSELNGLRIIDIGCGTGGFCREALRRGAASVLGLDISWRMCERAIGNLPIERTQIVNQGIEDFEYSEAPVDLLVSSLTLHYVADFNSLLTKITSWLKPGGTFLFSVNHPLYTANLHYVPDFESAKRIEIRLDKYQQEGPRPHYWFVDGVLKYHRTVATYLNGLVKAGFEMQRFIEPAPFIPIGGLSPELSFFNNCPVFMVISAKILSR